ncbi:PREDICTED: UPF0472 protein C16orf72-like [Elephantulus edwardii]|uniref:UPF0472 protein C16orf72-like n=1 Tax=Elephantulus edwardii TaxID=28737 RepID=UPI0003F0EA9C|nr:PREDICTED: UPF0472 protein C16orf72-like [Elephantulus edwardii]
METCKGEPEHTSRGTEGTTGSPHHKSSARVPSLSGTLQVIDTIAARVVDRRRGGSARRGGARRTARRVELEPAGGVSSRRRAPQRFASGQSPPAAPSSRRRAAPEGPCSAGEREPTMETPPREDEEAGSERLSAKGERPSFPEAEATEEPPGQLQEEAAAEATGFRHQQQRLWHLFQLSATAVAQLYKEAGCQQPGLSLWDPFQNAAVAVTSLYKESGSAHQRSFELGIQLGCQRRRQDVLEWAQKGRSIIRREDLISFLCGKGSSAPAPTPPRAPARSPSKPPAEAGSAVDVDLQPFHEAIALHGLDGAMAAVSVRSPPHGGLGPAPGRLSSGADHNDHDYHVRNPLDSEGLFQGQGPDGSGSRKRPPAPWDDNDVEDDLTTAHSPKRNRMM